MIIKICERCEIEYTPKHRGNQGLKQKYCSDNCRCGVLKGRLSPMRGKHHSEKTKLKLSKPRSEEVKLKISKSTMGKNIWTRERFGKNSSNWRGGFTLLNHLIRNLDIYKEWEQWIKERDNYTCQKCGQYSGILHSHHIKQFTDIMKENNITTSEEAIMCKELWDLNNGIAYCKKCHKLLRNKGGLL